MLKQLSLIYLMTLATISPSMMTQNTYTTHSSCDDDINNLGINIDDYSSYDNKLILMGEIEHKYLVLYFYNKDTTSNYQYLDFNYGSTELKSELDELDLNHYQYNVKLLSTSSDGLVDKLVVNFESSSNYRKYELRQLVYGEGTSSYTIGDSYVFSDNNANGVDYEVSKLDYLTFEDVVIYDYYLDTSDFGSGFFQSYNGQHIYFYGFTLDNYYKLLIEDLESVTFSYYESDLDAIMYPDNDSTSSTPGVVNPNREFEIYDYEEESLEDWWSSTGQELTFTTKYSNRKFIDEEKVEGREYVYDSPGMFFSRVTNSWNSIMRYEDIETVVTGDKLKEKLLSDFEGQNYIICLKSYDYEMNSEVMSINPSQDNQKRGIDVNISAKYNYLSNFIISGIDIYNESITYSINAPYMHVYNTKVINEAHVIRMFFRDIKGNPYDLSVIETPKNSSSSSYIDYTDSDDPMDQINGFLAKVAAFFSDVEYFFALLGKFLTYGGLALIIALIIGLAVKLVKWIIDSFFK